MADRLSAPLPSGRRASESNESGIVGWHSSFCPVRLYLPRGVSRAAFLAFLGLMVLFAHISAKRVAI